MNAIHNLLNNLNELYSHYDKFDNKQAINRKLYYLIYDKKMYRIF